MEWKISFDEVRHRLEPTLKPAEPPTVEEVLEQVSRHGVLRGPVDWVFPAWIAYVEYAAQKIAETFQLTEEERGQLFHFRDAVKQLLLEAWKQTKAKLASIYKAIVEGTYRIEGNRLYAPDGAWIVIGYFTPYVPIHGVTTKTRFPDLLKLPYEKLELLQLGWRASDEGNNGGRPFMETAQPWQLFAWATVRYGKLRLYIYSVNLTRVGISIGILTRARDWRQRWSKAEAIDLVANHFKHEEYTPVLTMWLGDGESRRGEILRGRYVLSIATKEPWRLGRGFGRRALVATGKEAFERLREAAGAYGELLDLLKAHKWIEIRLATDNAFRAAYKLKARKRSIDVLRETYGRNNGEVPTERFSYAEADRPRRGDVIVAGIVMHFELASNKSGSLRAERYVRDPGRALAIAGRLESAGLRPNITRCGPNYAVYIAMTDLLRLAERDEAVRRAIALYLAEKARNGTPRQREIAEKILRRHPLFPLPTLTVSSKLTLLSIN